MKNAYLVMQDELPKKNAVIATLKNRMTVVDDPCVAEGIVVLGGDGTMFRAIRAHKGCGVPFYGLNFGHLGFLMNEARLTVLKELYAGSVEFVSVRLLAGDLYDRTGKLVAQELVFNDFYFERASPQTANIRVAVDGVTLLDPLVADGVIVCTSSGSTAYNASADGVILPIGTNSMVLTGICPMLFHHWRTAQLSEGAVVTLEALDTEKRPVRFIADGLEVPEAVKALIRYSDSSVRLGFAKSYNYKQKVLDLQFNQFGKRKQGGRRSW